MTDFIGKYLNHYRIDALIGEGGMGAVYKATHLSLNRPVALKVMHAQFARRPQFQQRFLQEAQTAAQLEHDSIIRVTDFGHADGLYYMVMAFVSGNNLSGYITEMMKNDQVVPLKETLLIMAQVADALAYAHRHDVVHRDVKPDNILIKHLEQMPPSTALPIRAIVTDFGLAKLINSDMESQTGSFLGTLPYMSPEQFTGDAIDGRSDIYSLGIMCFQLTTGRLPFPAKSPTDAALKHLQDPIPLPHRINPNLPLSVEKIILKATAKRPFDRYQTASEMGDTIRQAAEQLTRTELTQFHAPGSTYSLAAASLRHATMNRSPNQPPSGFESHPTGDHLIISAQGQSSQTIPLQQSTLTIGRTQECHIRLDASGVSRRHAYIERTSNGWRIHDTGSANGTYLENHKLTPNVPEVWQPGQMVRIGTYYLKWQPAGGADSPEQLPRADRTIPTGAAQLMSHQLNLELVINPTHIEIAPDDEMSVQVELTNQGGTAAQYSLGVHGLPSEWVTIPQENINLLPYKTAVVTYSLHPTKSAQVLGAKYPYKFVVHSMADDRYEAAISCQLVLPTYVDISLEMQPAQIENGDLSQITIRNQGNNGTTVQLIGSDPAEAIQFDSAGTTFHLKPGQSEQVPVKIVARKRPFLGHTETIPFQFTARTNRGLQEAVQGQLTVKPVLPKWVAALLGVCLLLLCGSSLWGYTTLTGRQKATAAAETAVVSTIFAQANINATLESEGTRQAMGNVQPSIPTATAIRAAQNAPPFSEDCIPFDPSTTHLEETGGNWIVVADSGALLNFASRQSDAQTALRIIQQYGLNDYCAIGRPEALLEYFLVNDAAPVGALANEDCVAYNPSALSVVQRDGQWQIGDAAQTILNFGDNEGAARLSFAVLSYYQFNHACTVGSPEATMVYFRQ